MTSATLVTDRPARERRAAQDGRRLTRVSGLGLGVAMLWFSLLVLIPLTAVVVTASTGGWSQFWQAVTNEQTLAAVRLTVTTALLVTAVNVVMGTLIAWVLVRDRFFGKRALEVLIDLPDTQAFVQRSSLLNFGFDGGRSINVDLQGPDIERLSEAAIAGMPIISDAIPGAQVRPIPGLEVAEPELQLVPVDRRITAAGLKESHPHDIQMTVEAPNYTIL